MPSRATRQLAYVLRSAAHLGRSGSDVGASVISSSCPSWATSTLVANARPPAGASRRSALWWHTASFTVSARLRHMSRHPSQSSGSPYSPYAEPDALCTPSDKRLTLSRLGWIWLPRHASDTFRVPGITSLPCQHAMNNASFDHSLSRAKERVPT